MHQPKRDVLVQPAHQATHSPADAARVRAVGGADFESHLLRSTVLIRGYVIVCFILIVVLFAANPRVLAMVDTHRGLNSDDNDSVLMDSPKGNRVPQTAYEKLAQLDSGSAQVPPENDALMQQRTQARKLTEQADKQCGVIGEGVAPATFCNCDANNAIAKYRKGLELDSSNAVGHAHLAVLLSFVGSQLDEAATELKKAITLDPQELAYHSQLATVFEEAGHYDESEHELKIVLVKSSKKIQPLMRLGDLRKNMGDPSGAMRYYRQACGEPPPSDVLERNARTFACFNVHKGVNSLNPDSSPTTSPCDLLHSLNSKQSQRAPSELEKSKKSGCCCEPGESNMDCFRRCNAAVFPCP